MRQGRDGGCSRSSLEAHEASAGSSGHRNVSRDGASSGSSDSLHSRGSVADARPAYSIVIFSAAPVAQGGPQATYHVDVRRGRVNRFVFTALYKALRQQLTHTLGLGALSQHSMRCRSFMSNSFKQRLLSLRADPLSLSFSAATTPTSPQLGINGARSLGFNDGSPQSRRGRDASDGIAEQTHRYQRKRPGASSTQHAILGRIHSDG